MFSNVKEKGVDFCEPCQKMTAFWLCLLINAFFFKINIILSTAKKTKENKRVPLSGDRQVNQVNDFVTRKGVTAGETGE
jgi:hypothetical protein